MTYITKIGMVSTKAKTKAPIGDPVKAAAYWIERGKERARKKAAKAGEFKRSIVGAVIDVHPTMRSSATKAAPKPAPTTVAGVIASSRAEEGAQHRETDSEYASSEPVIVGAAPTVTPEQARDAHRSMRTNGIYSDAEPLEAIDFIRAGTTAMRNAS